MNRLAFPSILFSLILLPSSLLPTVSSLTQTLHFDVVVYGATPAGIAAAIVAANNTNLKVALLEKSPYVGGMSGPGGIGLRDIADPSTVLFENSVIHTWLHMNDVYYNHSSTPIWQPDQYIGQMNWETLVQDPKYNLYIALNTALLEQANAVVMDGTTIVSITTVDTVTEDPSNTTVFTAKIFIDASYEGDIMVAANLSYTYGREAREVYNESLAGVQPFTSFSQFQIPVNPYYPNGSLLYGIDASIPPVGTGDDRVMPYSYRLCVMPVESGNTVPWPQPDNYDPDDFEVLVRYTIGLNNRSHSGPSVQDIVSTLAYNGYPSDSKHPLRYDLCESGGSAVSSDEPTVLYTQYITGNRTVRKQIESKVKYWVMGMMYTLANHPRVPNVTRTSTSAWGLCADAWPNNNHWPELIYVREATRLIGDFVATQNNLVKGICVPDSIGLGGWTIDAHITRRYVGKIDNEVSAVNEGEIGFAPLPGNGTIYEIPYGLLTPKVAECTNLLVPAAPSTSHVSFSSIRVEPTFMQLGQAAGAAAIVAIKENTSVQNISIKALQSTINSAGQCVHWPVEDCQNLSKC